MVKKDEWTISNIILLGLLIIAFLALLLNFVEVRKLSAQQTIIRQEIDNIKATSGEFKTLKADNANLSIVYAQKIKVTEEISAESINASIDFIQIKGYPAPCPKGKVITFINFSGGYTICIPVN